MSNGHDASRRPIDLTGGESIPDCPRCGGPGLISARVPHGWDRGDGGHTQGTTVIVLCSGCDAGSPYGGPLITFFHVHGHIASANIEQAADLIMLWSQNLEPPTLDEAALDTEAQAWRQGEL